jgi:hypothetical protein
LTANLPPRKSAPAKLAAERTPICNPAPALFLRAFDLAGCQQMMSLPRVAIYDFADWTGTPIVYVVVFGLDVVGVSITHHSWLRELTVTVSSSFPKKTQKQEPPQQSRIKFTLMFGVCMGRKQNAGARSKCC